VLSHEVKQARYLYLLILSVNAYNARAAFNKPDRPANKGKYTVCPGVLQMLIAFWLIIMVAGCLAVGLFIIWRNRGNGGDEFGPWDEEDEVARKEPYFRREVVEAKVRSLFPRQDPSEILRLLDGIPTFVWRRERMQLNILKLSDGDMARLRRYTEAAGSQLGALEVVNKAEYPRSSRSGPSAGPAPKRVVERDIRQYLNWLKRR
jgi:hypothetical protein